MELSWIPLELYLSIQGSEGSSDLHLWEQIPTEAAWMCSSTCCPINHRFMEEPALKISSVR